MYVILSWCCVCYLFRWFFGAIRRNHAEKQLMQPFNDLGSFLVRHSETISGGYSLSIRDTDVVKHYRIRKLDVGGFFITRRVIFESIFKLIEYYQKQSDGLCVCLKSPCLISQKPQTAGLSKQVNKVWEIGKDPIHLAEKLGDGQFGETWKGIWNKTTEVAVKMLKSDVISPCEFLEEAALIKQLKH